MELNKQKKTVDIIIQLNVDNELCFTGCDLLVIVKFYKLFLRIEEKKLI